MRISYWSSDFCSSDLLVGLQDTATSLDEDATGRKIRAGHEIHQLVDRGIGRLDHVQQRVADFADVVRWDRGGHADRNALGAVGQQVREAAGQDDRLFGLAVIGRAEVDGILVNRSEEHTSELQSLMRNSYAVFCLKKKK